MYIIVLQLVHSEIFNGARVCTARTMDIEFHLGSVNNKEFGSCHGRYSVRFPLDIFITAGMRNRAWALISTGCLDATTILCCKPPCVLHVYYQKIVDSACKTSTRVLMLFNELFPKLFVRANTWWFRNITYRRFSRQSFI